MSRRPARFTQADVRRAVMALATSGQETFLHILPDGTFSIGFSKPQPVAVEVPASKKKVVV